MYVILGGAGQQGKAIVHYLFKCTQEKIVIIDMAKNPIQEENDRVVFYSSVSEFFKKEHLKTREKKILISCLSPKKNIEEVIPLFVQQKGFHYIDMGGDVIATSNIFHMFEGKKDNKSIIIPDCGLAPGIVSSYAGNFLREKDGDILNISCGGVPLIPILPYGYIKTFNMSGVIREYSGIAQERRSGQVVNILTLSEKEKIYIQGMGEMETNVTSGGLSLTPHLLGLSSLVYRTIRHPGHWDYIKENILWRDNPAETMEYITPLATAENPDIIILIFSGIDKKGKLYQDTYFWRYNAELQLSAMSQATGFNVAAIATMINDGILGKNKGVIHMHEIDFNEIVDRVKEFDNNQYMNSLY